MVIIFFVERVLSHIFIVENFEQVMFREDETWKFYVNLKSHVENNTSFQMYRHSAVVIHGILNYLG